METDIVDWVKDQEKDKGYRIHDIVVTKLFDDRYRVDAYRKKTSEERFVPQYNIQNSWFLKVSKHEDVTVIQDCTVPQDNPLYKKLLNEMKE